MNENIKRELIGVVVSDKAEKTITVKVETYKKDPKYGKELNTLKNIQLMTKKILQKLETKFV
jgi:small subunit ribosomal protein S17